MLSFQKVSVEKSLQEAMQSFQVEQIYPTDPPSV